MGRRTLDEFSARALSSFGFARIGEKLLNREALTVDEVRILLAEASIPALMKLTTIAGVRGATVSPRPAVVLPFNQWALQNGLARAVTMSTDFLQRIKHREVSVSLDFIDLEHLEDEVGPAVAEIAQCRGGISFVGPHVEDIIGWVYHRAQSAPSNFHPEGLQGKVESLLSKLRTAGFDRLRLTSIRSALRSVGNNGFPVGLVTDCNQFPTSQLLAEELVRISGLHQEGIHVDVWTPGYSSSNGESLFEQAAVDLRLLRVLAVGALVIRDVGARRASSRFLSLEGMQIAGLLGANDFGFGAVDAVTAKALHILPYEFLRDFHPVPEAELVTH